MYEFELEDERRRNASHDKDWLSLDEPNYDEAPRRLFADADEGGRPLNVNQAKVDFEYAETDEDIIVSVYLPKVSEICTSHQCLIMLFCTL